MNKRYTIIVGAVMGLAEVVPGVSGGTIAFVGGIYERLIGAIKEIDGIALQHLIRGRFTTFARKVDLLFLMLVFSGMAIGLVVGVFGISYLLENHPIGIWSFFFGLILASSIYLGSKIPSWKPGIIVGMAAGVGVAYAITMQSPSAGQDVLWAYLLSGAIAVSAMILPGISGSFILLLLGMYPLVLAQAKGFLSGLEMDALLKLAAFGVGAALGLAVFSRILTWLFRHYQYITYAVLTGFILGSLNKIWPWKQPVLGQDRSGNMVELTGFEFDPEHIKIVREENLSPFHSAVEDPHVVLAVMMCLVGMGLIAFLAMVEKKYTSADLKESYR